jgi:hypothetical protein
MVRWAEQGAIFFVGSVVVALALASCGGRASSPSMGSAGESGGARSTQGGAAGVGANSVTSSAGVAAALEGGSSGAVAAADAGPPVCNDSCPDLNCPSGQTLQYPDTLCCPICESCSAPEEMCPPAADCGPAAHLEIPAGQCCSQCVANDPVACMNQVQIANDGASAAYQKYGMQCQVDSDCAGAVLNSTCTYTCIYASKSSLAPLLAELAKEDCSACALPPPSAPTCVAPVCLNHDCTIPSFK